MEKISPSRDVAETKLLILYILDKVNTAIGGIGLTSYVLEERIMRYLEYQQRVHELIAANHIVCSTGDGLPLYEITDSGRALLSGMADLLPDTQRNRVDRTVARLRKKTIDERAVTAVYCPEDEYCGVVRIGLNEGGVQMLSLEIAAASKEEAAAICRNWKEKTVEIYTEIVGALLKNE